MKQKTILLTATLLILAACSQSEIETEKQRAPKEIKATSVIEGASTRAVITGDVTLNNLTFLRKDVAADAQTPSDFSSPDDTYTGGSRATGGAITFSATAPTYNQNNKKSFFVGFTTEGKKTESNAAGTFEWTIDGKTDILLTEVWDAGTYQSHGSLSAMNFKHQLSRIEVICKAEAGSSIEAVRAAWGNVTKIEVLGVSPELKYTYSSNKAEGSGDAKAFELLANDYSSSLNSITIHESNYGETNTMTEEQSSTPTPDAVAMIPPIKATTGDPAYSFRLKVTTAGIDGSSSPITIDNINVSLSSGPPSSNESMEAGKIHTVVLTFKADSRTISCTSSTIEAWTDGSAGTTDVEKPEK